MFKQTNICIYVEREREWWNIIQHTQKWVISVKKKKKTWMKLKCILSERKQSEKVIYTVWFQLYDILEKAKQWRQ